MLVPIRSVLVRGESHRRHLIPSPFVEDCDPSEDDSGQAAKPDSPLVGGHLLQVAVGVDDHTLHDLVTEERVDEHQVGGVGKQIDLVVLRRRQRSESDGRDHVLPLSSHK